MDGTDDGPLVPQPEVEPEPEPELELPADLSEPQVAAAALAPEPQPREASLPLQPQLEPEPEPEPEPESFDRYGLTTDCEHAEVYTCEAEEQAKEAERQAKWAKMLESWELYAGEGATSRRAAKLKRRVRKGIPVEQRGKAWFLLCGAHDQMEQNPGVYHDLAVVQPCPESYENQIKLDISRTITDHRFFRETINGKKEGQQVLYRVLRAYAVYNHKVAYCQGMSYLAGMFLCQGVDEEEGFWMMRQFMNGTKYNLCGLFEDGFPLMNQYLDTLSQLLFEKYPAEAHHIINSENVVPIMFAEKWLLTLFMYNWPYKIAVRIWDVMITEGPTAFFGFALSVFELSKAEIIKMDTEQLLLFLTGERESTAGLVDGRPLPACPRADPR